MHDTTTNEVPLFRLKSRKPYIKEAQEILIKCHPWGPVEGCMDCGNVEAGVGSIWTHLSRSQLIVPRRRRQGRGSESKSLDDSKQTANWGRSVQSIHEEVGNGGQCGMWVWTEQTADHIINSCPIHRPPSESCLFEVWAIGHSMAPTDWVNDLIRWYTKEEEVEEEEDIHVLSNLNE